MVCVTYATAIAQCADGIPQNNFTGYEVALWRQLADRMHNEFGRADFAPGNWQFLCVDRSTASADMLKPVTDPTRVCNVSLGGFTMSSEYLQAGVQFSPPTYEGSLQILIHIPSNLVTTWTFLAPFKAELWLALFGTGAVVAVVVWLQELSWSKIMAHPAAALNKLAKLQWGSAALTLQMLAEFNSRRFGARISVLGFGFLVLIAMNSYMAALASRLTVGTIKLSRYTLNDLAAVPVGVAAAELNDIRQRTSLMLPVPLKWDGAEDEREALSRLRSAELQALLLGSPWVQYQAATSCDLYVVGESQRILAFRYGFAFDLDAPHDLMADVGTAMAQLVEEGVPNSLDTQYIRPDGVCPNKASQFDLIKMQQLGLEHMYGLWIFLAASMGAGWAIDASVSFWRWRRRRRQHAGSAPGLPAPGGGEPAGNQRCGAAQSSDGTGRTADGALSPASAASDDSVQPGLGGSGVSPAASSSLRALGGRLGERTRSFFGRPEVAESWMAIADASTVEEMVQLLELQLSHMDSRLRKGLADLECRMEAGQRRIAAAVAGMTEATAEAVAAAAAEEAGEGRGEGVGAASPLPTPFSLQLPQMGNDTPGSDDDDSVLGRTALVRGLTDGLLDGPGDKVASPRVVRVRSKLAQDLLTPTRVTPMPSAASPLGGAAGAAARPPPPSRMTSRVRFETDGERAAASGGSPRGEAAAGRESPLLSARAVSITVAAAAAAPPPTMASRLLGVLRRALRTS